MSRVPAWADTQYHEKLRRLKVVIVVAFFAIMFLWANLYVHLAAKQAGEIQGPTLLDLALARRIVKNKDKGIEKQKVTIFGTCEYDYLRKSWTKKPWH